MSNETPSPAREIVIEEAVELEEAATSKDVDHEEVMAQLQQRLAAVEKLAQATAKRAKQERAELGKLLTKIGHAIDLLARDVAQLRRELDIWTAPNDRARSIQLARGM